MLLLNQRREKIMTFGDPETFPGGNALRHFNSASINIRRGEEFRDAAYQKSDVQSTGDKARGKKPTKKDVPVNSYIIQMRPDKNKTAYTFPVMRTKLVLAAHDDMLPGEFDHALDVIRLGQLFGVVQKEGSMYAFDGDHDNRVRGIAAAKYKLRNDNDLYLSLYAKVLEAAIGEEKFSEIKTAAFLKKSTKAGKADSAPMWRKKTTGKRK